MKQYEKPTLNDAQIAACLLTPYKIRLATYCVTSLFFAL